MSEGGQAKLRPVKQGWYILYTEKIMKEWRTGVLVGEGTVAPAWVKHRRGKNSRYG